MAKNASDGETTQEEYPGNLKNESHALTVLGRGWFGAEDACEAYGAAFSGFTMWLKDWGKLPQPYFPLGLHMRAGILYADEV
jgi:hypothetical protein